jgi:hypothetical protein
MNSLGLSSTKGRVQTGGSDLRRESQIRVFGPKTSWPPESPQGIAEGEVQRVLRARVGVELLTGFAQSYELRCGEEIARTRRIQSPKPNHGLRKFGRR